MCCNRPASSSTGLSSLLTTIAPWMPTAISLLLCPDRLIQIDKPNPFLDHHARRCGAQSVTAGSPDFAPSTTGQKRSDASSGNSAGLICLLFQGKSTCCWYCTFPLQESALILLFSVPPGTWQDPETSDLHHIGVRYAVDCALRQVVAELQEPNQKFLA